MALNSANSYPAAKRGGFVMFNPNNRRYYDFDALAAYVWQFIQQPRTLSEIRDAIVEKFGFEPDYSERDVRLLLEQMEEEGLIEARKDERAS
jgi:hypothetical protein